jgi:3-oxoadipate enol-lactonase
MPFKLSADITGPEKSPAIVFSHALGGDLSMWDRQVAQFAGQYRTLRYNLRGHGRSPQGGSDLKLDDLGTDVLELLDQHGIERAHFCGLSLGGLIGQWLGIYAPQRLLSLTLVDSAPRMGSPDQWDERIGQIEQHGMSAISSATMERWFTESFRAREPETVARICNILEGTSPDGYIACAKVVRNAGIEYERLKTITVPTLVMTGTYDAAAKPEECRKMAAQIPRSRYVELTAAHISPVEASDQFNQALRAFLDEARES